MSSRWYRFDNGSTTIKTQFIPLLVPSIRGRKLESLLAVVRQQAIVTR